MRAQVFKIDPYDPDERTVSVAAGCLREGGIVAAPTDTLYGLLCDATDEKVLKRLCQIKGRDAGKGFVCLIRNWQMLEKLVEDIPLNAIKLAQKFWPGPLTLIFEAKAHILPLLTGGRSTIAVRIPASPLCLQIMDLCGFPLAAPSANKTGETPAKSGEEVMEIFGEEIDLVLDGGFLENDRPSTIVDAENGEILRKGALPSWRIEALLREGEK